MLCKGTESKIRVFGGYEISSIIHRIMGFALICLKFLYIDHYLELILNPEAVEEAAREGDRVLHT